MIKCSLHEWHLSHSSIIEGIIIKTKDRLHQLDIRREVVGLDDCDREELHSTSSLVLSLSKIQCSMHWQKACIL